MKKPYFLFTALICWLLFPCVAQGQGIFFVPSSKTKLFSDIRGEEVIVREWSTGEPLVHVRDADYPNRHWFLLGKNGTEQMVGFSFDSVQEGNSIITLYVNDMQVYGDSCYFCGEVIVDYGAPVVLPDGTVLSPRFLSHGFIGRMGMSDTPGDSWRVDYTVLKCVDRLQQLAVYHPDEGQSGFKLLLVATAESSDLAKPSCLVEMKENLDLTWEYSILQTNKDGEVFTDVLARGDDLFVSSHVDCGDDATNVEHWFHYVHWSFQGGFGDRYASVNFMKGTVGHDCRYLTAGGYGWGWHRSDTPMRMCMMDGDTFCLSYTVQNYTTGERGVVFYPMVDVHLLSPPRLYGECCESDVVEIAYAPVSYVMAVLLRGSYSSEGYLLVGDWCSMPMGGAMDRKEGFKIESMCRCGGRSFFLGGHRVSDRMAGGLTQQARVMWPYSGSCFTERRVTSVSVLNRPKFDKQDFEWSKEQNCRYPEIEWKSVTGSVAVWPHTVPCFHNWVENAELD